jgi:serine/threonine-protein kinase
MAAVDPFGLIGQILDGQMRVDQVIGEGGFSIVYKGEHIGLGEPIAIKCLKLPRKLEPKLVEAFGKRFRDEGRLLYRLSQGSLYIVRSITSGTCIAPSTGMLVPYMALEWLDGHSLVQEFKVRRARGQMPLSLDEAVKLFDSAAQALAYAHSQGVAHRDVKPGNLVYTQTREGRKLKVLDFGLAKIFDDEAIGMAPSVKTQGNIYMCSPSYGAPEQFDPRIGEIGPWTDVYALALVFTESLADKKARHAESMAEGALLALNPATRPTPRSLGVRVNDAVEALIARAVSFRAKDRPQTCGEFWSEMKAAVRAAPRDQTEAAHTVMDPSAIENARAQLDAALALVHDRDTHKPQHGAAAPSGRPNDPAQDEPAPRTARMVTPARPPGGDLAGLASTVRMDPAAHARLAQPREQARMAVAPTALAPAIQAQPPAPPTRPSYRAPPAPVPPFDETSYGQPPKPMSSSALTAVVVLLVLALMAAAAWGGYVLTKHRAAEAPPPAGTLVRRCPSSRT